MTTEKNGRTKPLLRLFPLESVEGGDTYELAPARSGPDLHWKPWFLYFSDDEDGMGFLAPYLNQVFPVYAYYGPQKVTLAQWERVEKLCRADWPGEESVERFFAGVRRWLEEENQGEDFFWIQGI